MFKFDWLRENIKRFVYNIDELSYSKTFFLMTILKSIILKYAGYTRWNHKIKILILWRLSKCKRREVTQELKPPEDHWSCSSQEPSHPQHDVTLRRIVQCDQIANASFIIL